MSDNKVGGTSLTRWVTFFSVVAILIGIGFVVASRYVPTVFLQDLLLGLGLALAPSGIVGLLADWLVFGQLIDALNTRTDQLGTKTESLGSEINSLRVSTEFLKQSSDLGLEMIYTDRAAALRDFSSAMEREAQHKDGPIRLIIVGSSIKGLIENVKNTPNIIRDAIKSEETLPKDDESGEGKSTRGLKILLTHPEYSKYRENQEDRPYGAIEDEIFDGIRKLEECVETDYPAPAGKKLIDKVKLYKGTPTCFMIVTGNRMLVNPYPYEEEAYKSFCIAVRKVEPREPHVGVERTIYAQYLRAHFEKPWERNAVPYAHYWLEGPDPGEAWDRKSSYGDVFAVQDASGFYLAVYLLGQRKADVRGMPTSILGGGPEPEDEYLTLPSKFSVRLFDAEERRWRSLDNEVGLLTLHPERRRGKVSGQVTGNLLNDYLMIGLFDPRKEDDEKRVVNRHKNLESAVDGLKGEPLPLFWVSLARVRSSDAEEPDKAPEHEGDRA